MPESGPVFPLENYQVEVFLEALRPKSFEVCEMMQEVLAEQEAHHLEIFEGLRESSCQPNRSKNEHIENSA
jgi:hypothetical protein